MAQFRLPHPRRLLHKARIALLPGALSIALYALLYRHAEDIRHIGEATSRGDKMYFLLPIGIALVFSLVHGWFSDRFWEALGLKAKR